MSILYFFFSDVGPGPHNIPSEENETDFNLRNGAQS